MRTLTELVHAYQGVGVSWGEAALPHILSRCAANRIGLLRVLAEPAPQLFLFVVFLLDCHHFCRGEGEGPHNLSGSAHWVRGWLLTMLA